MFGIIHNIYMYIDQKFSIVYIEQFALYNCSCSFVLIVLFPVKLATTVLWIITTHVLKY